MSINFINGFFTIFFKKKIEIKQNGRYKWINLEKCCRFRYEMLHQLSYVSESTQKDERHKSVKHGPTWAHMGPYGPTWAHGPMWAHVLCFCAAHLFGSIPTHMKVGATFRNEIGSIFQDESFYNVRFLESRFVFWFFSLRYPFISLTAKRIQLMSHRHIYIHIQEYSWNI